MSLRRLFRKPDAAPDTAEQPTPEDAPARPVALRQLVLATSPDDVALPAWESVLTRIGTPYDVLFADREVITRNRLVRGDVGRYNAVLLTNGALLHPDVRGRFVSAFDPVAWDLLWEYERAFGVRQVALNAAPGAAPEGFGLRLVREGATGAEPLTMRLTEAGAEVFDYLRPDARLPLADAYVYRTRRPSGANVEPLLESDGDIVAALAPARDGRERLVVCFTVGADQPTEELLGYGLVRWATRGVLLGEHRHWLNVDVDDWSDLDGTGPRAAPPPMPASVAGAGAVDVARAQEGLRAEFPLAAGLTLNLAYNAGAAPSARAADAWVPAGAFRWVNHTYSHPSMEASSYEQSYAEIEENLTAALRRGLPVDPTVLKTPGYSGLGVLVAADATESVVDSGLEASNPRLLEAARDLGVRYVHGNMSFPSHRPECFNGGTVHPLEPGIVVVPDWPVAIPWWAGTPDELVRGFATSTPVTAARRGSGRFSYEEIIELEAEVAYRHVIRGSAYTHTLHRANTYEYAPGRSLAVDWLRRLLERYSETYQVPLLTPDWTVLAGYVVARSAHARALEQGPDAVWDREEGVIRYVAPADTTLFVTGANGPDDGPTAQLYGTDRVVQVTLRYGREVMLRAVPRA
ncbi:MAG: Agd3-related carbohydrate-binding protein [Kineosporiaceae bacterium]